MNQAVHIALAVLAGLVSAFFGPLATASVAAAPALAAPATYHYDASLKERAVNYTAPERGPPHQVLHLEVSAGQPPGAIARGDTACPVGVPTSHTHAYDRAAQFVQAADVTTTTHGPVRCADGDLARFPGAGVAANGARSAVQGSRVVSGRFPRNAGPDDILVRRGADGGVTNYQTYGPDGLPLKRVDVTGRAHGGIDTPHVVDFERHVNPATGEVFVSPGSTVRPATTEELMGLD